MAANSAGKSSTTSSLSDRGLRYKHFMDMMSTYFEKYLRNKYDRQTNPQGIINLSTSENELVSDLIVPKLNEDLKIEEQHTHYFEFEGTSRFRKIIAKFLEHYMKPVEPIDPAHIIALNGCGVVVKCLGSVICDPGDGILIPTPYYGGFDKDLYLESEIVRFPVHLSSKASFELTAKDLEDAMVKAKEKNVTIRALLLCNPNNPLGTIYSEKQIRQCMQFTEKHSLHLIVDEIYMLCIFKQGCSMTSALAINGPIDPERLHILWAFSKDFGISGFRAGVLYSRNKEILESMKKLSHFHAIPSFIQETLGKFISDYDWLDSTFIPTNHKRLRECHGVVSQALQRIGVPVLESCSGLYVWVDLRDFVRPLDFQSEKQLTERLIDEAGVYINNGSSFNCVEPGWFRIVIASYPEVVKLGIERLVNILKDLKT